MNNKVINLNAKLAHKIINLDLYQLAFNNIEGKCLLKIS